MVAPSTPAAPPRPRAAPGRPVAADGERRPWSLLALVAFQVGCVATLQWLGGLPWSHVGWSDPVGWLVRTPAETAVAALAHRAGLVAAWWSLATTLAYVAARMVGLAGTARAAGALLLPGVRRVVDRALAVAVATTTAAANPIAATAAPRIPPPPATTATTPYTAPAPPTAAAAHAHVPPTAAAAHAHAAPPAEAGPPLPGLSPPLPAAPVAPDAPAPAPSPPAAAQRVVADSARHHTIAPGENLWWVAATTVARMTGRPQGAVPTGEVAAYWLRLVEDNRGRLRSGDPDLVFPGEVIVLPPLP